MSAREQIRRWWRLGKRVVLDQRDERAADDEAAWKDAIDLWNALFQPFAPVTEDADVLEIGCGDGRLLGAMASSGRARSALGLDRAAFWNGEGEGVAWPTGRIERLELHGSLGHLKTFDENRFDLILCRELDAVFSLGELESGLARLYDVLRPGGEAILRARCGPARVRGFDDPGYGFMTPTAWVSLLMRAGFEPEQVRRIWRDPSEQAAAQQRLPHASDDERLAAEVWIHVIRPWESWELDVLHDYGDRRRKRKKKKRD